nr:replication endonuclease [Brucella anthropi]
MTAALETRFSSTQNEFTPQTKNVDDARQGKSFLAQRLAAAPLLSRGFFRKEFEAEYKKDGFVGGKRSGKIMSVIKSGDADKLISLRSQPASDDRIDFCKWSQKTSDDRIDFYDLVEGKQPRSSSKDLDRLEHKRWLKTRILDRANRKADLEELDAEENSRTLLEYLPEVWKPFLEDMKEPRRSEREDAIWKKIGRDVLHILQHDASELADYADMKARAYARKFPTRDEAGETINQEEKHQKGRCEKWHLRRLKKQQMRALLYIEAAIGAVGGPMQALRPLYVSDYVLERYLDHVARTEEILKDLKLLKKLDPTVQIPMTEVNRKAKRAAAAKRRLLMDMTLSRWEALEWHVCWITITLPGEFVPHSTNERVRKSRWNSEHGPAEAMDAIQLDMKRTMALLRDRGVRPTGWWNVQPQQSGAPHRHIILACEELEDARAVCDAFRDRFSTRLVANEGENDGQDHGCAAYVIGDDDPRYKTKISKNGSAESATSAAKYAARYATRNENEGDLELCDKEPETEEEAEKIKSIKDFRRFLAWKWGRRARTHTWIGLDAGRGPLEIWDALWANAQRSDYEPDDARMAIAMSHMRSAHLISQDIVALREKLEVLKNEDDTATKAENLTDFFDAETREKRQEDIKALTEEISEFSDTAAYEAWHAAIAAGIWSDCDLDKQELHWLHDAVREWEFEKNPDLRAEIVKNEAVYYSADALPPMPLRDTAETQYGGKRSETIGAVAPVALFSLSEGANCYEFLDVAYYFGVDVERRKRKATRKAILKSICDAGVKVDWKLKKLKKEELQAIADQHEVEVQTGLLKPKTGKIRNALKEAGIYFLKRPNGTLAGYNLSGEILLRTEDEWEIVDSATAQERIAEFEKNSGINNKSVGLSDIPTDPSYRPDGLHLEALPSAYPPPN